MLSAWLAEEEALVGVRARAFVLATSSPALGATARHVQLIECDSEEQYLLFGTHSGSLKARQLVHDPRVEAVFGWGQRQVRVRGKAIIDKPHKAGGSPQGAAARRLLTRHAYSSLPRGAQLSLRVAHQGRVIDEVTHLAAIEHVRALAGVPTAEETASAPASGVACAACAPADDYTAVLIDPATFEFYQGNGDVHELGYIAHDRFLYVREKASKRLNGSGSPSKSTSSPDASPKRGNANGPTWREGKGLEKTLGHDVEGARSEYKQELWEIRRLQA